MLLTQEHCVASKAVSQYEVDDTSNLDEKLIQVYATKINKRGGTLAQVQNDRKRAIVQLQEMQINNCVVCWITAIVPSS